jgi:hypothetical protein
MSYIRYWQCGLVWGGAGSRVRVESSHPYWRHLVFHKITNLKHKFAAMFIHIGYHPYVVNIHFEQVQSSLESCITSKLTDCLTPTSCQMKWRSTLASIRCYVQYNVSSCKLP